MAPERRLVDLTSIACILLTILAGILVYPQLPDQVAIHFTATGTPDNYVPRTIAIVLLPGIMAFTYIVLRYTPRLDPTANRHVVYVTTIATMLLLTTIQGIVLAWNLGYPINMDLVLPGVLVWTALVVGYAFYADGLW